VEAKSCRAHGDRKSSDPKSSTDVALAESLLDEERREGRCKIKS